MSAARAALLSAAVLALGACADRGATDVVIVTLDTFRADRMGCYGSAAGLTPRLDAFARTAAVFADASCATPVTLPSHATLFTGRYPTATGVRNNGTFLLPPSETTLAEILSSRGWRTGAVIAAFPLQSRYGLAQGFDLYDEELPALPPREDRAFPVHFSERDARAVTDRALSVWGRLGRGPRFLWVHYFDPHAPYAAPERWAAGRSPYDGEIAYVDSEVGRLLDATLRDAPRALVVITADHGESLGEHGEKTHGVFLYQSTVRVPLMIRAPGLQAGRVIPSPVTLADVLPTVLALLGEPPRPGLDGADLGPLIAGTGTPPAREVYAESHLPQLQFRFSPLTMLRGGSLKYVEAPSPELYDLSADPSEVDNLSGRPASEDLARRLAALTARADPEAPARAAGLLDRESEARLRSLGYVSAGAGSPPATRGRDPKTMASYLATYDRAVGLVASGRIDEGLLLLRALVPQAPENYMARYQIAAGLLASGRPGDAAVELEQVVAAAPELGSARLMLAEAVAASGRLDDALASFDAAAALMPHAAEPRLAAGRALEARGRFDAAAEAYRDAAVREPASAEAARALLSLRAGRGDLARGIAELDRLASDHPRSAALRVAHAEALHRGGDPAGAARAVDAALELDPDRVDALLLRANLHAEAGRTGEAAALYRTILRQRPDLPAAEWGLARALVAGGSDEDAVAAIDAFAARYPGRAQGDVLRGMLFERRGDTPAAVRAYESALAIDPGNAAARRGLERLLSGKASR